jgi:hypothetical protein
MSTNSNKNSCNQDSKRSRELTDKEIQEVLDVCADALQEVLDRVIIDNRKDILDSLDD